MSKKLWGGLIIALFACWLGLKSSPEHSENHNSRHSAVPVSAPSGTRAADITALTSANQVAAWIHQHHRLPRGHTAQNFKSDGGPAWRHPVTRPADGGWPGRLAADHRCAGFWP